MTSKIIKYGIAKVIPAACLILLLPYQFKVFGEFEYGVFSLYQVATLAVSSLWGGWIGQIYVRYGSSRFKILSMDKSIKLGIVFSILGLSLSVLLWSLINSWAIIATTGVLLLSIAIFYYGIFSYRLQGLGQAGKVAWLEVSRISTLVISTLVVTEFFTEYANANSLLIINAISFLIPCIIAKFINYIESKYEELKDNDIISNDYFTQAMLYSIPLSLWYFVAIILNLQDRYFINLYLGEAMVGSYSIQYDIIYKIGSFATAPIIMTIGPELFKRVESGNGSTQIRPLVVRSLLLISFVSFILLCSYYFIGDQGFELIYSQTVPSNAFETGYWVLGGSLLWSFAQILQKKLEARNKTTRVLIFGIITLIANFAGNLILVPSYGTEGAAISTFICTSVYAALAIIWTN